MIVGNEVTITDIEADPIYNGQKVTVDDLAKFTLNLASKNAVTATKLINGVSQEYGDQRAHFKFLVMIYNATGSSLTFRWSAKWRGSVWKYPADTTILNGQWSCILYQSGSFNTIWPVGALCYSVEEEHTAFLMGFRGRDNALALSIQSDDDAQPSDEFLEEIATSTQATSNVTNAMKDSPTFNLSASIGDGPGPITKFICSRT